jgi:RND family efflux transporter MFP subunit
MGFMIKLKNWLSKLPLFVKLLALLLLVSLVFLVFKSRQGKSQKVTYQTAKVEKGTVVSTISASGSIVSSNFIPVDTTATGVVKSVFVKEGQKVYQGQKIASIELDFEGQQRLASAYSSLVSANNALNAANNNLRQAEASLEKVYDDIKGHDTDETFAMKETRTKAEVAKDNAYDNLKNAQASLSVASLNYRMASPLILAPISGTVGSVGLANGMVLGGSSSQSSTTSSSQTRVAVIVTEGNPIASFNVSEIDIPKVKQGQKAIVTLDSITDKTFTGKVVGVDRVGVTSSGVTNYPVLVQLDNSSSEILPNMSASVNIILETKTDVLTVPNTALVENSGEYNVQILQNGKVVNVPVKVGISSDSLTEIVSGLKEGDEVITGTVSSASSSRTNSSSPFSSFGGAGFRIR